MVVRFLIFLFGIAHFDAAFEDAMEEAADLLESEARRRAHDGVEEPVFGSLGGNQGSGEVGRIRKYSDTLLIFLLKGARPDKYRERQEHQVTGSLNLGISSADVASKLLPELAAGNAKEKARKPKRA